MTFDLTSHNIIMRSKLGGEHLTEKKKMGRPTDDPKPHKITARLNDETLKILDNYCKKKSINRPEGIREAVYRLKDKE